MGAWLMNLGFAAAGTLDEEPVAVSGGFFLPTMGEHSFRLRVVWWALLGALGVWHGR